MTRLLARIGKALLAIFGLMVLLGVLGLRCDRPAAEVEARRGGGPSKFVVVDGLRTHYRDRGQGPVVVLLHGSNASLLTWEGWTAALSKDHRVIAVDLPGHGLTGPDAKKRYQPAGMTDFLELFVAQLGLERFVLAGNSMGGGVAWHYALRHPDKVERLILVDAGGYPREEPAPLVYRIASTPGLGKLIEKITPRFMVGGSLRECYGDPSKLTDARIDEYHDLLLREGNRAATGDRVAGFRQDDDYKRLAELKMPTLILWGERDKWVLPKYGQRFQADIKGSRLVMLPGLGHVPMEEDPAVSVMPVRDFLAAR